jgi:RHS repeat-associated protein
VALKRIREGGFQAEQVFTPPPTPVQGWVPTLPDGQGATWVAVGPNQYPVVADRFGYGGREKDPDTGLGYAGGRFYDEELGRYLNEDPHGLLGTNPYRYALNSPRNVAAPAGRPTRDLLDAATDFFAGASDVITAGLTQKIRQGMGTDQYVNTASGAYRWGGYAGRRSHIGGVGFLLAEQ